MELFREHLKKLMDDRAFSKKSASEKAGLETSTVRKILKGGTTRVETIVKLSNAFGIYPSEVLPIEWQKPINESLVNQELLQKSITKALELKSAAGKNKGVYTERGFAILITNLYLKLSRNEPVNDAEIIRLIRKDSD